MKKETTIRGHQPAWQTEQEARKVLQHCVDQLATTSVGTQEWIDATALLGQIDPEYAPIQLGALADDRYQVCRALSIALSRVGPLIFDDAIQTISHEHPRAREFACGLIYGLHQRGGADIQKAVGPLAIALQDEDCRVRQRAVVTLCHIGEDAASAVESLTAALSDPEDFVREWAAYALAAIGPAARSATFVLQESLSDAEPAVREAALEALMAVGE